MRGLYAELGGIEPVIARLRADAALDAPVRRLALEEALRQKP